MNEQEKSMTPETAETDTVMGVNEENITSACACAKAQENAGCRENAHTCAKKSDKKAKKGQNNVSLLSARTKKQLLIVSILIGALLFGLVAFLVVNAILNNRPPKFSVVKDRFEMLINTSTDLNQAVFGAGLPVYSRLEREVRSYTVDFKGEERTLLYYEIADENYGTVVSYEYQIKIMDGKVNADGIKIYTIYDVESGEELSEYNQGAARFVERSTEEREGYVFKTDKYFYYKIENYVNPDLLYAEVYSGKEDENYDYVRFDAKYKSVDELKEAVSSIYSNAYIAYIYEILFTGTIDLRGQVIQALYIDYKDEDSGMFYLMRSNTSWEWREIPTVVYDFSTMTMDESQSNANSVCVRINGYEKGKESEVHEYEIWFARENNAWYLDSPTY